MIEEEAKADRARKLIDQPPLVRTISSEQTSRNSVPKRGDWQQARIKEVLLSLPAILPDGSALANLTDKQVRIKLKPEFEKRGWKLPSTDSIGRVRRPHRRHRR
jgi:hypothetical protein